MICRMEAREEGSLAYPSRGVHMHFSYVWEPYVQDHLLMGWMFARDPCIYERGEYLAYLMCWPCECKVPSRRRSSA